MATFRVQNLSGSRLAVPPPLDVILPSGASADVEAASADTAAIKDLLDRNLVSVTRVTSGLPSEAAEAATLGLAGSESQTTIGTIGAPVVLGAGDTATLSHALGTKASKIDVYAASGGNVSSLADITITQADADTLAVQSTAGGSFVIVASWEAGVVNTLGSSLAESDSLIAVA